MSAAWDGLPPSMQSMLRAAVDMCCQDSPSALICAGCPHSMAAEIVARYAEVAALREEVTYLRAAIEDEQITCEIPPLPMHDYASTRAAIQNAIRWNCDVALNPAVSEDARKLQEQARAEAQREVEEAPKLAMTMGREAVAQWMIERSYATGHGETIDDLLGELRFAVRAEALREAAEIAEDATEDSSRGDHPYDGGSGSQGYFQACRDIAATIRALIEKEKSNATE